MLSQALFQVLLQPRNLIDKLTKQSTGPDVVPLLRVARDIDRLWTDIGRRLDAVDQLTIDMKQAA